MVVILKRKAKKKFKLDSSSKINTIDICLTCLQYKCSKIFSTAFNHFLIFIFNSHNFHPYVFNIFFSFFAFSLFTEDHWLLL